MGLTYKRRVKEIRTLDLWVAMGVGTQLCREEKVWAMIAEDWMRPLLREVLTPGVGNGGNGGYIGFDGGTRQLATGVDLRGI